MTVACYLKINNLSYISATYLLLESVNSIFPSFTCLKSDMAPAWLNPRVGTLFTDKISSPANKKTKT